MAQYLSPGVYVEEVPSAIKPIAGVSTSTAGFIGVVADSVNQPLAKLTGAKSWRQRWRQDGFHPSRLPYRREPNRREGRWRCGHRRHDRRR